VADLLQEIHVDRRIAASCAGFRDRQAGPLAFQPVGAVRLEALRGLELLVQRLLEFLDQLLAAAILDRALGLQPLGIDLAGTRMVLDLGVIIGWVNIGSSPSLWPWRR
jgi:hypothetical protein